VTLGLGVPLAKEERWGGEDDLGSPQEECPIKPPKNFSACVPRVRALSLFKEEVSRKKIGGAMEKVVVLVR